MSSSIICSRTGPGTGRKTVPGPILLLGAPGVGKGTQAKELVKICGTFRRSPPATCCAPMWLRVPLGQDGQGDHGARGTGSRFAGQRDGGGAPAGAGYGQRIHPGRISAHPGQAGWLDGRLAAQTGVGLPVVAVSIQVDYNQLLRRITGRGTVLSARPSTTSIMNPPTGWILRCRRCGAGPASRRHGRGLQGAHARLYEPDRAGCRALPGLGRFAEVDGDRPIATIAAGIVAAVERLRHSAAGRRVCA
jgi:adenylate kinase